ncbi:hypothetical protein BKA56DRAFT_699110, partial [Ilyonectria sp. MPI-CAGE-AT-0026]
MSGRYVVFFKVFEALFYRCLHYAGLKGPHSFKSAEDVAYLIDEWKKLALREGAAESSASASCAKPVSQFGVLRQQRLWDACSSIGIVSFFIDRSVVDLMRLIALVMHWRARRSPNYLDRWILLP